MTIAEIDTAAPMFATFSPTGFLPMSPMFVSPTFVSPLNRLNTLTDLNTPDHQMTDMWSNPMVIAGVSRVLFNGVDSPHLN